MDSKIKTYQNQLEKDRLDALRLVFHPRVPQMKISQVTSLDPFGKQIQFSFQGHVAQINALRRTIVSGLKTMAIDIIKVVNNSTTYNSVTIADQLSGIPLKVPTDFDQKCMTCVIS